MNQRMLLILLGVTIVVVLAAFIVSSTGSGNTPKRIEGEPPLANLEGRVNEVAAIHIVQSDGEIELTRRDNGWVVASNGGYPADFVKVKQAIMALAGLERVEAKTNRPEMYARIGVVDPKQDDATSTLVTLRDDQNATLGSIIIGNRSFSGGSQQVYVRDPDEKRAWLVEGRVSISADLTAWVDSEVLAIPRNTIDQVTITHPDGEEVVVVRDDEMRSGFTLMSMPADRELQNAAAPSTVGASFVNISMENVQAADEVNLDFTNAVRTECVTTDGRRITAYTVEQDGATWARFEVEVENENADADDDGASPEAANNEAEQLRKRLAGWVFALPQSKANNLRKRHEDLLKSPGETTQPDGERATPPGLPQDIPGLPSPN